MGVYKKITDLIGGTPILELTNTERNLEINATLLAKLEYFNPAGSVKDRIAKAMIDDAEAKGLLKEGSVIIEPTSGNTGIGLASVAASRGYRLIITMPETMSIERRNLMKAYGAELVLTEGSKGMKGAIAKAEELSKEIPNSFIPSQFTNPANPAIHEKTTGVEIWNDTDGKVDIFVAGVGTGGTLSGVGAYLKSQNPDVKIVAVEPKSSPVLSEGKQVRTRFRESVQALFLIHSIQIYMTRSLLLKMRMHLIQAEISQEQKAYLLVFHQVQHSGRLYSLQNVPRTRARQ